MADALTAEEVGRIVAYIAPGFVMRMTFAARFGRAEPSEFALLISSVVLSLPLVALANGIADVIGLESDVTQLGYVAVLLGVALVTGYLAGAARASPAVRGWLRRMNLSYQPDSSIYAQTLLALPPEAAVTVTFKDGRKLSGTPKLGPGLAAEGIAELYVTHPAWWSDADRGWQEEGAGGAVIVPLAEVQSITLDRDPTP